MERKAEIVHVTNNFEKGAALERRRPQPLVFNEEDSRLVRTSICPTATETEFASLMKFAALKRLNPLTKQVHFVKRRQQVDGQWIDKWETQVGIDGFRAKAEETGLYDGQDEPEFEYETLPNGKKRLLSCKVRVYRKDWSRPAVGVAYFEEYAQRKSSGDLTKMWADKPHVMLSKCAEALGLRKAFPDELGNVYTDAEIGDEDAEPRRVELQAAPAAADAKKQRAPQPPTQTEIADSIVKAAADAANEPALLEVRKGISKLSKGPERDRAIAAYRDGEARLKAGAFVQPKQPAGEVDSGPCGWSDDITGECCTNEGIKTPDGYRCRKHTGGAA